MKSLIFVTLFALAFAEPDATASADAAADPGYLYRGYYGYPYARVGYHGLGYHGLGYRGLGYRLGKRSADAEPTADADASADPGYLYGYGGGYYPGYAYGGLYGHPYRAYGYGYHYVGKRSADPEPTAEPGYVGAAYYAPHYPVAAVPVRYPALIRDPLAKTPASTTLARPGYVKGYHYVGKRSADAEPTADADASAGYLGYYGGYYGGYPYARGYYSHPYRYGYFYG